MIERILHMIRLGRVTLVDDTDVIQRLQVDEESIGPDGARRLIDKAKRFAHFGLHRAYNAHKHTGVTVGSGSSDTTDHAA